MLTGILAGLAAGALWGLVFVAPRMVTGFTAVDFTAGRFVSFGALSMGLMLVGRKTPWPSLQQALAAVALSVLGFTGYYLLLVYAITDIGTALPSLIIGTIPLWMLLLGRPAGLRWTVLWPGLLLTALGMGLMAQATLAPEASLGARPLAGMAAGPSAGYGAGPDGHFWRGIGFATAAMVCWTVFGLLNAAWLKKHPNVSASTWTNWLGLATGLGALVLWMVVGSDAKALFAGESIEKFAIVCIATGVGSAWLATVLWNIASQRLSASLCGQLILSETIFALVYSFIWDGHWPSLLQLTACALFVAGILASIRAHR